MNKKLTPKQNRFVLQYIIDLNGTQAAIRAGYSEKTAEYQASRLLSKVKVQEAVQEALKLREERTAITADYVLTGLKKVHERCAQEVPVLDREGNPTGEYRFDASGANKALELLGKHLKLFTDKIEARVIRGLEDLTDDEIATLLADLKDRA
jgi:phage terminase small subunit